ncbi:MAG: hypothetical protein HY351_03300 [Candidatus Omnitrophica bacterium]|nr:hypothetical protein [Candidatus Omnitrophota bacterium]
MGTRILEQLMAGMIPPPACQERAYESNDQARSCISSRSHRPRGGEPWAMIEQVVG